MSDVMMLVGVFLIGVLFGIVMSDRFEYVRGVLDERRKPKVRQRVIHKQTGEYGTVLRVRPFGMLLVQYDEDEEMPTVVHQNVLNRVEDE